MNSPTEVLRGCFGKIRREWKLAFISAVLLGLLIHVPAMLQDIPNHDGLDSVYFDQNMVTSGRWFLMVACGFSSFYTLPWLIGVLGILFLGLTAALLTDVLNVKQSWAIVIISGLLVAFPALSSTFAYVFTLDGYMLALLLSVASVWFTKQKKYGFVVGGVCLAFSMGTYQAYLPFAMLLSLYVIGLTWIREEKQKAENRGSWKKVLPYLYMGLIGCALYYVILQILLRIQGKELAAYQGIDGMKGGLSITGILGQIPEMYRDFVAFTIKGNVLYHNLISALALTAIALAVLCTLLRLALERKWWKKIFFFVIILLVVLLLPLITNVILVISPEVNYHLLMRYQWVLFLIGGVAFVAEFAVNSDSKAQWMVFTGAAVLVFFYGVTDNIAYSNLAKKYEKTYAYCIRMLDRIEQTPGYYQGIPIAMIGVVGDEQYPSTDVTTQVTDPMIGMDGDFLLYRGDNYRLFMKYYLGATLNILPQESMADMYYDQEYTDMDSFPGENSIRIIDGVMYIKTENTVRE